MFHNTTKEQGEKRYEKRTKRVLSLIIGFAAAMILMSAAIYFGYTKAYSTDVDLFTVKLFGIPIYELRRALESYTGISKGIYMGAVCGIGMAVAFAIEEIIKKVKHK